MRLRLDDIDSGYFLRDNVLHVIPQKSHTNRRKAGPSRLRWDLRAHPELAKAREQAIAETDLFAGYAPEELPGLH